MPGRGDRRCTVIQALLRRTGQDEQEKDEEGMERHKLRETLRPEGSLNLRRGRTCLGLGTKFKFEVSEPGVQQPLSKANTTTKVLLQFEFRYYRVPFEECPLQCPGCNEECVVQVLVLVRFILQLCFEYIIFSGQVGTALSGSLNCAYCPVHTAIPSVPVPNPDRR